MATLSAASGKHCMNAIEAHGLTKLYGSRAAVQDLDLTIPCGEIYGFLGENGAGKSTTIRMILGLIWPDRGEAFINGLAVRTGSGTALHGVGAMLDNPCLYGHLSVEQNLRLFARLSGDVHRSQVDRALSLLGLSEMRAKAAGTLSHGQKQRVGIAQALLPDSRLLILDEPQNGLDPLWIRNLREILKTLSQEGVTILISSHRLHEIEQVCHRVGIIHDGRMRYEGPVTPLLEQEEDILVGCSEPQKARQALIERNFKVQPGANGCIKVRAKTDQEAAQVNEFLVSQGFSVFQIERHKAGLEDMFFILTRKQEKPCDADPAD